MSDYLERTQGGTCFTGSDGQLYSALAIASQCGLYAKTKLLPNRNTNASDLLRKAEWITKKTYKRGEHAKASADLTAWANEAKAKPRT